MRHELAVARKIAELQQELAELRSTIGPSRGADSQRKRRRDDSDSEEDRYEKDLSLKGIDQFTRSFSLRQRQDWLHNAERIFRGSPRKFRKEQRKVLFALDHMEQYCRTLWQMRVQGKPQDEQDALEGNWVLFSDWTLSIITNAENRGFTLHERIQEAQQSSSQSPRDFAAYLGSLEAQVTQRSEEDQAMLLYSKLQPEIKRQLQALEHIPRTRQGLIERAETFYQISHPKQPRKNQTTNDAGKVQDRASNSEASGRRGGFGGRGSRGRGRCNGRGCGSYSVTNGDSSHCN